MWSFPIYAIFTFPVRFCQFLPIRHLTGDIAPLLHSIFLERFVIFRQFCHSHVACPIFALFPRLSYNQGHLSGILFNFRYLVIFWSDLPFSPFWSGFGIFYQIRYFTKKSFGASFQFASTLWWFFSPNSQLFALLTGSLRFRRIRHLVRLTLWPGTSHGVLWSFTISAFFNFSVRFWPFLPIGHLTRDISLSIHYIFVERFVIFRHFCHSHLPCQVFALFSRLSFYHGYLSGILFNFRYLVIFWSDLPFSPLLVRFWHIFPDCLFYQKIFWSLISICVNPLVIFLAKFTTFCPPDRFSPFPQDSSFSQIDPLTRDISRSLVIFHHICFFQLFCQVLAVSANWPFDQGYLTEHPLHIRRTFCDLSPFLSFSPSLSGFRPFFQIVILPWISLGHSIQFPLFGNFFSSDLPFSPFWSGFGIFFPIGYFYQKIISICVNPLVIFLAKFTTFHPPDRFSAFPPDSSF